MINRDIIGKYALILAVSSIFVTALQYVTSYQIFSDEEMTNRLIQIYIPIVFSLTLDLITALIVRQDIRKHNVKTKYIMVATILFRPAGVFAFLMFLFFRDKLNKNSV